MATPTFSGLQHLIWNFQERVVSDDFNRAEQFAASALAELLRLPLTAIALESEAEGKTTPAATAGNPLRAVVFEGIRFRPEIGTTTGFVEPGCALVVYPDASPHPADSPARLLLDPGVQSAGTLTLTAGGGGARVDVVECQPTNVVTEADSRDVFDPSTGLFSPSLVNKVARGGLTYRIRTGTAGAGFPGTASGWLPIAVCLVPSSATTWDDCTVWDVRPLLADLARPPHVVSEDFPRVRQSGSAIHVGAGVWQAKGVVDGELNGWKCGGELAPSASGADFLLLNSAGGRQEPGFSAVASTPWYLYLVQPFGLPRWVQLTPSTSGGQRRPIGPRGIPVFTQKAPEGLSGRAGSAIALPTATGLGSSSSNALAVMSGAFASAAAFCGVVVADGWSEISEGGISTSPTSGAGTLTVTYRLVGNTNVPAHARAVRVRFLTTYTDTPGYITSFARRIQVYDAAGGNLLYAKRRTTTEGIPVGGSFVDTFEADLEIPPNYPGGTPQTIDVQLTITATSGGAQVFSSQSMLTVGWRLFT